MSYEDLKAAMAAEGEAWRPEDAGEAVYGVVVGVSERTGNYDPYKVITVECENGDVKDVYAQGTVLADRLSNVKPGDRIGVEYRGTATGKGGSEYKSYKVVVDSSGE